MSDSEVARGGWGFLEFLKGWLPVLAAIAGGLWAVFTYIDHQTSIAKEREISARQEVEVALVQAQRPFLERQMALYFETANIAGSLSRTAPGSGGWKKLEDRFWVLYWSELSLVEGPRVEASMIGFGDALKAYKQTADAHTRQALEIASYDLAHALRDEIRAGWGKPPLESSPAPPRTS